MRFALHIAGLALLAALVLSAAAPGGLSFCVQSSGKASIGLSCTCESCEDHRSVEQAETNLNCCQRCESGDVLNSRCCTCTKLPALASAITAKHDFRPKPSVLTSLKPPVILAVVLLPSRFAGRSANRADHPPPLPRTTVLRL